MRTFCFFICAFWFIAHKSTAQTPAPYDILINEFMPDPTPVVGLPAVEWIELYNRSNRPYNLNGFKIVNGSVSTVLPNFTLQPARYLIVYTKKTGIDFGIYGDTVQVQKLVSLSNPNDTIYLQTDNGTILDAAAYNISFYQNSKKNDGGWSLERRNPNAPCRHDDFSASNDLRGGTPGTRNSIATEEIDRKPAQIQRHYFKNDRTLVIYFDKSLDRIGAAAPPQYSFENGANTPRITNVKVLPPMYDIVELSFNQNLESQRPYLLLFSETYADCQGIRPDKIDTLTIQLPEKPQRNDLIINEILPDPEVGGSRFIEIYNNSDKYIDVGALKIADLEKQDVKPITTNYIMSPDSYLALSDNTIEVQERYAATLFKRFFLQNKLPTWDAAAGNVALYRTDSARTTMIDSFSYTQKYHNQLLARTEGVSLERINPNANPLLSITWQSAAANMGYASPAQKNSQYRSDFAPPSVSDDYVGAFWFEYDTFSPDADGYNDFLIIRFNSDNIGWTASIRIFTPNGVLIKTIAENDVLTPESIYKWDGDRNDGTAAAISNYVVVVDLIEPQAGKAHRQRRACGLIKY